MTIAVHIVLSGYGTWFPNDPRGSGSTETRKDELRDLGDIHHGRKRHQPSRDELRRFFREANEELDHQPLWFNEPQRNAIGNAFGELILRVGYTVWACAVCSNHAHILVRTHRNHAMTIRDAFANASREALLASNLVADVHPVWSSRPYWVLLETPDEVRGRIDYIRKNPLKEGLPLQHWDFVRPYDGWPLHKRERGGRRK